MSDIFIHQDGRDFRAPDIATLKQWVRERRLRPDGQIFEPTQERWVTIRDHPDLQGCFADPHLDVAGLARNYRQLVLWVGFQLVLSLGLIFNCLAVLIGPAIVATVVALVYYAYRTAETLGSSAAAFWAVAMLVPVVNVITLLVLSSKATAACRANGIEVGFLGPRV